MSSQSSVFFCTANSQQSLDPNASPYGTSVGSVAEYLLYRANGYNQTMLHRSECHLLARKFFSIGVLYDDELFFFCR